MTAYRRRERIHVKALFQFKNRSAEYARNRMKLLLVSREDWLFLANDGFIEGRHDPYSKKIRFHR